MIQTLAWTVLLLMPTGENGTPAEKLAFSSEAQRALDRALASIAVTYQESPGKGRGSSRRHLHAAAKSFAVSLDQLAGHLTNEEMEKIHLLEANDIRAKLAVMARDRRDKIDLYESIENTYVVTMRKGAFSGQVAPPPRLVGSHLTEPYRLVWEYYLLSPMPEGATPMYIPRVTQALSVIHGDASVRSLLHCFELTCRQGMPSDDVPRVQEDLLDTLDQFRTAAAARGLLTCVELAAARPASPRGEDWNVEDYVYRRLKSQNAAMAGWQPVLKSLDREGLTNRQTALLDRALAAYP